MHRLVSLRRRADRSSPRQAVRVRCGCCADLPNERSTSRLREPGFVRRSRQPLRGWRAVLEIESLQDDSRACRHHDTSSMGASRASLYPKLRRRDLVTSKSSMTNEWMLDCSNEQTGGVIRSRQPACQRGARPSGRAPVAAKQPEESLGYVACYRECDVPIDATCHASCAVALPLACDASAPCRNCFGNCAIDFSDTASFSGKSAVIWLNYRLSNGRRNSCCRSAILFSDTTVWWLSR